MRTTAAVSDITYKTYVDVSGYEHEIAILDEEKLQFNKGYQSSEQELLKEMKRLTQGMTDTEGAQYDSAKEFLREVMRPLLKKLKVESYQTKLSTEGEPQGYMAFYHEIERM